MRVGVVGAGIAGLVAARELARRGHDVTVFEREPAPGGRLATVRLGPATADVGAQFFTVRTDELAAAVARWQAGGLVAEWCHGFAGRHDGYPRYRVNGGMQALARHLAGGLDARFGAMVFALFAETPGWRIRLDDGAEVAVDAAVVTCPVPQAMSLAITAEVEWPARLRDVDYERTIALVVELDGPSAVPPPGGVQDADAVFSFVADNAMKGISAEPALTLHASTAWSAAHYDDRPTALTADLLAAAAPWIGGARVVGATLKRWRFATPTRTWPERCVVLGRRPGPLVLAGDAYGGPRVEGAYLSGLAAAAAVNATV